MKPWFVLGAALLLTLCFGVQPAQARWITRAEVKELLRPGSPWSQTSLGRYLSEMNKNRPPSAPQTNYMSLSGYWLFILRQQT